MTKVSIFGIALILLLKYTVSDFFNFSLSAIFIALLMGFKLSEVLFTLSIFNSLMISFKDPTPVPPNSTGTILSTILDLSAYKASGT